MVATVVYSAMVEDAVSWANQKGLTKYNTPSSFMQHNRLRRDEAAKFFVEFAKLLGKTEYSMDVNQCNRFPDINKAHSDLQSHIIESCRMGILQGGSDGKFYPTSNLTNAQTVTALVRIVDGYQSEEGTDWSANYYKRANELGILAGLDMNDKNQRATRGVVITAIYTVATNINLTNTTSDNTTSTTPPPHFLPTEYPVCGRANEGILTSLPTLLSDLCSKGSPSVVNTNTNGWTWNCFDNSGEYAVLCSATTLAPTKTNGVCGSANGESYGSKPNFNLCSVGTASSVNESSSSWTWTCAGFNGGVTASCSAIKLVSTNGSCGSAATGQTIKPTSNLCSTGTPSTVSGSGPWTWTCTGTNGGTIATCSAAKVTVANGTCSSTHNGQSFTSLTSSNNLCSVGTVANFATTNNGWTWTCSGVSGGTTASCAATKVTATNGACSSTHNGQSFTSLTSSSNLCSVGTIANFVTTSNGWTWNCAGTNGGTTASCSAIKLVSTNGSCGSAATGQTTKPTSNLCATGTPSTVN